MIAYGASGVASINVLRWDDFNVRKGWRLRPLIGQNLPLVGASVKIVTK
jgi:hypothetical protein